MVRAYVLLWQYRKEFRLEEKLKSSIGKITLKGVSAPTFSGETVEPALINFFYGKNGTGKSTIGRVIKNSPELIEWTDDPAERTVLVFNQDFIEHNVTMYADMPGVFSMSEANEHIEAQINAKLTERDAEEGLFKQKMDTCTAKQEEKKALGLALQEKLWEVTDGLRKKYGPIIDRRGSKSSFTEYLLSLKEEQELDMDEFDKRYSIAFSAEAKEYPVFCQVHIQEVPGIELLSEQITSSADTPFATFIKTINASDWVRTGHRQFHAVAGDTCPYCQKPLPDDFEEKLAECFDETYSTKIRQIDTLINNYALMSSGVLSTYKNNMVNVLPGINLSVYESTLKALEERINSNRALLETKKQQPSQIIELQDITEYVSELNSLCDDFNYAIEDNNKIVKERDTIKANCKKDMAKHLCAIAAPYIEEYNSNLHTVEKAIFDLGEEAKQHRANTWAISNDIKELNKDVVNTDGAMENIQALLRDSGFQGFTIQKKSHTTPVDIVVPGGDIEHHEFLAESDISKYEIVRDNGDIAEGLSEGERNFLAFLYFNELVKGIEDPDAISKHKVVVIDDPVSSMDSGVMFLVASLVRNLIEATYNEASISDKRLPITYNISQLFILTHNAYFHREITYNQVKRYKWNNFYLIDKHNNKSSVRFCVRKNDLGIFENYNPVQNSYAALWEEYKEAKTTITLLNIIRRILEYYFLQMCGYDGNTLRKIILEDNRQLFVDESVPDKPDMTLYNQADAMLQYISTNSTGILDGLFYVDSMDPEQCRITFHKIFDAMKQTQHFEMMIGLNTSPEKKEQ